MDTRKIQDSSHRSAEMKRRSFFGYALAGGVGAFSLKGLMNKLRRSTISSDTAPQITVSINPLAVPRTKESSETDG